MVGTDFDYINRKHSNWRHAEKDITFAGGTTNAIGDHDGTGDPFTIFTVTGTVAVRLYAICTTTLEGASATLEVGVTGTTAGLIPLTTATNIAVGEIWHDASPDAMIEAVSVVTEKVVSNGLDIKGEVKTANITAGAIKFICRWRPISADGDLVPA